MMNRPSSRLIDALRANSDALLRLTSDFRFQLSNYQVVSFYEMKPPRLFSSLVSVIPEGDLEPRVFDANGRIQVVEKHSALLNANGEDQIPVDANHSDMCKFKSRDDEVYEKLYKRVLGILRGKGPAQIETDSR